jgi:uncharacterized RDD family membrane protein YckC
VARADRTSRAVAGFVDLLLVIGLTRLPDVLGFLSATGYILARDGLFSRQSIGKKLIGLRVISAEETALPVAYRESIIRNAPLAVAYILFLIPYAGWVLGPLALGMECLAAVGDEKGMRIGDMLARTVVMQEVPAPAKEKSTSEQQSAAIPSPAAEQQEPT